MSEQTLLTLISGIFVGALPVLVIFLFLSRRRSVAQSEIPLFSTKDAETLLKRSGYRILNKRPKETIMTVINGKEHFGYVEADYLVDKERRKYAAIVHAAGEDADPNEPTLRRRILECDRAFSPNGGVLVVDLVKGRALKIRFRFPREWNIDMFFRFLIALFIISLIIGIIWVMAALKLI
jgi:hypothetical protein